MPVLDTRAVTIQVFALIEIASNIKAESNSSGLDRLAGSRHTDWRQQSLFPQIQSSKRRNSSQAPLMLHPTCALRRAVPPRLRIAFIRRNPFYRLIAFLRLPKRELHPLECGGRASVRRAGRSGRKDHAISGRGIEKVAPVGTL